MRPPFFSHIPRRPPARLAAAASMSAFAIGALALAGAPLAAQSFPAFGGIEARAGIASPEDASTGFGLSADVDLGSLGTERLRTLVGFNYFGADVEREAAGQPVGGSLTAIGGRIALRLDLVTAARVTPYLLGQVGGWNVDAGDVEHAETANLLDGFVVGAGAGGGIAYRFSETGSTSAVLEARQVVANNLNHWAVELGIRYGPRGPRDDDWRRARLDAERRRLEADRERIEAERVRALSAQEEARRGTLEEQRRADSVAAAARQASAMQQDAALQRSEAERRAAEAERERLQRAAAAADEARRQAEREAAAAQAARMDAERQAREAAERAAAAERQLRESVEELGRVIANVSGVRETERGLLLTLGQGLFATGQTGLSQAARADMGRIAAVLGRFPDRAILVEGHTDATGSEATNQRVSDQRANSVRAALIAEGIDPNRITAVGYGLSRPVADNSTASGRAQNRRVDIVVLKPAGE